MLSGADPSVADGQGLTAMHYASVYGSMELNSTLIEHGPAGLVFSEAPGGETSLFVACHRGHLQIAKALIKAGGEALLLKTTENGCSCLYIACAMGHLEVAKALFNASGDSRDAFLLMTDSVHGLSCLHSACHYGHAAIVAFLLSLSCAGLVGLRTSCGRTALDLAVAAGQTAAAEAIRAASGRPTPPRRPG